VKRVSVGSMEYVLALRMRLTLQTDTGARDVDLIYMPEERL